MQESLAGSLLNEDDWRGWLQQRPTQEFLAGIADLAERKKELLATGKHIARNNPGRTQFESGYTDGYLNAIRHIAEHVIPEPIADEMPEVMRRLGVSRSRITHGLLMMRYGQSELGFGTLPDRVNVWIKGPVDSDIPWWSRVRSVVRFIFGRSGMRRIDFDIRSKNDMIDIVNHLREYIYS